MKRVDAADRVREAIGDRAGDPGRHVAGHQLDLFAAFFAELVEEPLDRLAVTARGGPDQSAGVVIDDDGQVALALAMTNLVDADSSQPVEQIDVALRLVTDAFAESADRAPRDPHQLGDRRLGCVDGQPRGLVLEGAREPRAVPGPRDCADHHAVTTTTHPRRVGLHERQRRPEIQRSPTPASVTLIEPRTAPPAHAAAISLAPDRPYRDDNLILTANLHVLDDRPLDAQQPRPYPDLAHAVSAPLGSSPEEAGTLGAARRAPLISWSLHPRQQQERPFFAAMNP